MSEYPHFEDISSDDELLSQATNEIEKSYQETCTTVIKDFISDDDQVLSQAASQIEENYGRFAVPKIERQMTLLSKRQLSESTKNKSKWTVRTYKEWAENRNTVTKRQGTGELFKMNLEDMTTEEMNVALSKFITEVRKVNGADYPGSTLYEIFTSIQLYLEQCGVDVNFFSEPVFNQLKNTVDSVMRQRSVDGIGTSRRQAQVITVEEENLMWDKNILGSENPQQLQNTLLYLLGINFALRAAKEHRSLRLQNSQLSLTMDSRGKSVLRYTEDVSKARHGGLKHRKKLQKVVDAYPNESDHSRCVVALYRKYVNLCPRAAVDFYLRPLTKPRLSQWYGVAPVGLHTISATVSKMAAAAGLSGFRTNHSLRATAATRLYRQNVNEQLIKETTGHSSDAVQTCKRTSEEQKEAVSRVLQCQDRGSVDTPKTAIGTIDKPGHCIVNISCEVKLL